MSRLGRQWRERKCQNFETVAKGDSNPGSLDCESGILPLSYRAPQINKYPILFSIVGPTLVQHITSSYRVYNGAHPSHSSTLHFCDVVFAWYLPEMCAARHDNIVWFRSHVAAPHIQCFFLTVAPQMFRCRGGSLSRAHSVGRPPCRLYATAVCHHSGVVLLDGCHISSGCSG